MQNIHPYTWIGMKWKPEGQKMSLERYYETVCESLHYTPERLKEKRRFPTLVMDRQLAIYVMRVRYKATFAAMARLLDFDHTTMISALNAANKRKDTDELFVGKLKRVLALPIHEFIEEKPVIQHQ
jgi:chromosomal replication initiation ATPase DnaA